MAKGRVGGTKAKIRGQVGDTIYQIRNNGDGTYTQIVMEKGERTETETSELLQAQRMCTAMVQAFMRDLKSIGQISVQSAKTKTESLNALSSLNLKTVRQDCIDHWYDKGDFYFPWCTNKGTLLQQVGGQYHLSQGTLQNDIFDNAFFDEEPYRRYNGDFTVHDFFYALRFDRGGENVTVGQFLANHRMTRKDQIVLTIFHEWSYEVPEDESYEFETAQDWMIAQVNPEIGDDVRLTTSVMRELFIWESSIPVTLVPSMNAQYFAIGFKIDYYTHDDLVAFMGAFSISYYSGKKQVKSSRMYDPEGRSEAYLYGARPTNVFYSWMRAPKDTHWPSPFEQR